MTLYYSTLIRDICNDLGSLLESTMEHEIDKIIKISELFIKTFKQGNKIFIFGNGGSAADAQHLAAEFVNRFLIDRSPLPAIALHTDSSVVTSISNDFSYADIFKKQVQALGARDDIAWGISTSGNSENVLKGFIAAKEKGLVTVGFSGAGGGKMGAVCDFLVAVNSKQTPRIQEIHILLGHIICQIVEDSLFGNCRKGLL